MTSVFQDGPDFKSFAQLYFKTTYLVEQVS